MGPWDGNGWNVFFPSTWPWPLERPNTLLRAPIPPKVPPPVEAGSHPWTEKKPCICEIRCKYDIYNAYIYNYMYYTHIYMNVYLFIYLFIYLWDYLWTIRLCRYWIIAKTNMFTPWFAPAGHSTVPLDNGAAWKLAGGCVGLGQWSSTKDQQGTNQNTNAYPKKLSDISNHIPVTLLSFHPWWYDCSWIQQRLNHTSSSKWDLHQLVIPLKILSSKQCLYLFRSLKYAVRACHRKRYHMYWLKNHEKSIHFVGC